MIAIIIERLAKRHGDEYIAEKIADIPVVVEAAAGVTLLAIGLVGVWFTGCALI